MRILAVIVMPVAELQSELFEGVRDGRRAAIEEAPHLARVSGLKSPNYRDLHNMPMKLYPMPLPVLGATNVTPSGGVSEVSVNSAIPYLVRSIAEKYGKSKEWAKNTVYRIAKHTAEHELAHVFSSKVAKGEKINDDSRKIMESI